MANLEGIDIRGPVSGRFHEILSAEALAFLAELQREFNPRRKQLLHARQERQVRLDAGETFDFLPQTQSIRETDWKVSPAPSALQDRRVEITGPVDRKMVINALNSGARMFMADFEDATSPAWTNIIEGQANLIDAIEGTIEFHNPDGRSYRLNEKVATLLVRPRGWHLPEKHILIDGEQMSGSLLDFGLYFFHNARRLLERGFGPYFYLPKMESHLEARLWNDVFNFSQDTLSVPRGSVRATVLVETLPAAFEMDEILYELREHSAGLNAGRWDYIFSLIKKLRSRSDLLLPDRAQVTMTVPFMRAYTELLVRTCHRRGAHAIGGMAAFVPSRRDVDVNRVALAKVREDKVREASDGFEGTWVAHPDLVPAAMEVFDGILGAAPNQLDRQRDDVNVSAADLLNIRVPGGEITEAGLRNNISVGIQYIESWLRGVGAVALYNLMEDAATAEISRSQVWQWVHHSASLSDGQRITPELVRRIEQEELHTIRQAVGGEVYNRGRFDDARRLFEQVALSDEFVDFLTQPAYQEID